MGLAIVHRYLCTNHCSPARFYVHWVQAGPLLVFVFQKHLRQCLGGWKQIASHYALSPSKDILNERNRKNWESSVVVFRWQSSQRHLAWKPWCWENDLSTCQEMRTEGWTLPRGQSILKIGYRVLWHRANTMYSYMRIGQTRKMYGPSKFTGQGDHKLQGDTYCCTVIYFQSSHSLCS